MIAVATTSGSAQSRIETGIDVATSWATVAAPSHKHQVRAIALFGQAHG
jgi:hypothetical protein